MYVAEQHYAEQFMWQSRILRRTVYVQSRILRRTAYVAEQNTAQNSVCGRAEYCTEQCM